MMDNRWIDTSVDTNLYLQLQDLTTVLSDNAAFTFAYTYGSTIDIIYHHVTGSSMWDMDKAEIRVPGYKTDVFLRTIGTLHHTHVPTLNTYLNDVEESKLPKFATQLVTLLEDIRLEEIVKHSRPGTKRDFAIRTTYLQHFFTTQLATNVTRSYALDELFCLIYLLLQADQPDPEFPHATTKQLDQLKKLKSLLYASFDAKTAADITNVARKIVFLVEHEYTDMVNDYFTFPIAHIESLSKNTLFDELTRTDELANQDLEDVDEENNDYFDEPFSTWHRENQNSDRKQNFLQFELEVGTKTNIRGGNARETEDGDQATASVQGTAGKSEQNDYSEIESLEKQENKQPGEKASDSSYGEANKHAVAIEKNAIAPSEADRALYRQFVSEIDPFKRRLARTIEKTIEHKQNAPRKDLVIGRLSKKLLPLVIDENPRVFYKKSQESHEVDAVFTLLVDCSASMHNKMDETKRGITLFHEVLNQLKIPHSIVGFWEDANESKENYQPNYFHRIHAYNDSFYQNGGAKIMQLEPEEDNRDGFSIHIITKELMARREKNKFLLIFSDGEPAAMGYDQNGIVDTNIAVANARKQGIEVIGMFLSDGEIDEHDDATMKNIYGKERLMVPSVAELPEQFGPLLKRLLLKVI
ncbi:VWA domain-containing protein [Lentibacillus sp. N15]|uniref:vWA domain-containing protein n=1 Tax=Lentibacillus songyuanensis TaxID=3136161 RepID=UPI0031BA6A8B